MIWISVYVADSNKAWRIVINDLFSWVILFDDNLRDLRFAASGRTFDACSGANAPSIGVAFLYNDGARSSRIPSALPCWTTSRHGVAFGRSCIRPAPPTTRRVWSSEERSHDVDYGGAQTGARKGLCFEDWRHRLARSSGRDPDRTDRQSDRAFQDTRQGQSFAPGVAQARFAAAAIAGLCKG